MRIIILLFILFFWIPCFAQESKVYTDQNLNQYKSGKEESSYQYNQRVLDNIEFQKRQQEMKENYEGERKAQEERDKEYIKMLEKQAEIDRLQREQQIKEEKRQRKRERIKEAVRDAQQSDMQMKINDIYIHQH